MVLKRLTVRGSIVGTRADLREALEFAARGEIEVAYETRRLEDINEIFDDLKRGTITGRIVLDFGADRENTRAVLEERELATV